MTVTIHSDDNGPPVVHDEYIDAVLHDVYHDKRVREPGITLTVAQHRDEQGWIIDAHLPDGKRVAAETIQLYYSPMFGAVDVYLSRTGTSAKLRNVRPRLVAGLVLALWDL